MPQLQIPNWVKERQKQQIAQKADRSIFFKFPEGETEIEVDVSTPPIQVEKFNKTRFQYQITVNKEVKTLEVGTQLDTMIITALMKGLNPMVVVRVGTGIKSQYSIKGLN